MQRLGYHRTFRELGVRLGDAVLCMASVSPEYKLGKTYIAFTIGRAVYVQGNSGFPVDGREARWKITIRS